MPFSMMPQNIKKSYIDIKSSVRQISFTKIFECLFTTRFDNWKFRSFIPKNRFIYYLIYGDGVWSIEWTRTTNLIPDKWERECAFFSNQPKLEGLFCWIEKTVERRDNMENGLNLLYRNIIHGFKFTIKVILPISAKKFFPVG